MYLMGITDSIIVFTNGFLKGLKGKRPEINANIEWIVLDEGRTSEHIIKATNSESQLKFCNLPQSDPKRRCPDISKAREMIGWEPKITFDEGLKKTIEYFRKQ